MLRNARKQDRRCCNTVAQCWMMPDKTRMRMPAKSLNRPQRSNVTAAKDNNNIHRFPAAVNRSAQHRPHRTKFGRRLSAKATTSRRKETILSTLRPPARIPDRHSLCALDTALTKNKDRSVRVEVRKIAFSYIARESGSGGCCGGTGERENARRLRCVA